VKVVYEGALFPGVGGGPSHFAGLSKGLLSAGASVTHVLPRTSELSRDATGIEQVRLPVRGSRVMRNLTYELSRIALFLRWWVTGRRVDVWIARHSVFGFGLVLARLVATQVVLEVNGPVKEEMQTNFGSRRMAEVADRLLRFQARSAHLTVPVTPGLARYLRQRTTMPRCEALPNGASPVAGSRSVARDRSLVFAGALTPWYELDVVLTALRRLRNSGTEVPLVVVGDGICMDSLKSQAADLGIADLVAFAGWVDGDTVQREIQHASVGILPLRPKNEELEAVGSPLKLYEYVAAGLRVIGTDIDGVTNSPVREAVHTYRQGDSDSCAKAIREALDADSGHRLDESTWSWDSRARQLVSLLGR
jgi:glycosyltransferase involved in cell wall biosynthesis